VVRVSAEIVRLSDYRTACVECEAVEDIDLATAVDVAIRDLREIQARWGSDVARQIAQDCEQMLRRAFTSSVAQPPAR
jgi:hypothetical protein